MNFRPGLLLAALVAVSPATSVCRFATAQEVDHGRFSVRSTGGGYELAIQGLIQVDGRLFAGEQAPDRFLIRRARLTFDGSAGSRTSFRIRPESSNGEVRIVDAYVDTELPHGLNLRVGKFKPPVGLERLQSAADLRVVERSFVTELLPSRDVGVQLDGGYESLSWAIGVFNGVPDGRAEDVGDDGQAEGAARVFFEPVDRSDTGGSVFGFGLGATFGSRDGDESSPLLVGYRSPGQETLFTYRTGADGTFADGRRLRLSPQMYWYRGPFGIMAEWARLVQDVSRASVSRAGKLEHDAWQVTAEWFVAGGTAGYQDPDTAGGVQVVSRIGELVLDGAAFDGGADSFADHAVSVGRATSAAIGVNWFPLPRLKASLVYQHTTFDGGAAAGDRPTEKLLLARLQHEF